MSIINQALKKAQREQMLRTTPPLSGWKQAGIAAQYRLGGVIFAGFAVALGLGAILHAWVTVPPEGNSVGAHAAPEPLPQLTLVTSDLPSVTPAVMPLTDTVPRPSTPGPAFFDRHSDTPAPKTPPMTALNPASAQARLPRVAPLTATPAVPLPVQLVSSPTTGPAEAAQPEQLRARALFNQAMEAQEAGDLDHARTLLEQTIQLDPTLKVAYNSLGNLHHQQQQYEQAIVMYERALALDPQYAKARNNLGSTYMQLTMDDRALTELHKAIQADSGYGLAYYNLACVYARAGDSTTAAQYLQQAMALEPQARIWAQTDDDFAPVRATPAVQALLGP
jgi:Tfp pilus assembly protein PilF